MQHLKNLSCGMKKGRDKSPNLIFPGPNHSRTWAQLNCCSLFVCVQTSVSETSDFFFLPVVQFSISSACEVIFEYTKDRASCGGLVGAWSGWCYQPFNKKVMCHCQPPPEYAMHIYKPHHV